MLSDSHAARGSCESRLESDEKVGSLFTTRACVVGVVVVVPSRVGPTNTVMVPRARLVRVNFCQHNSGK